MDDVRLAAVKSLLKINRQGAYSNLEIRRVLSRGSLKGADRGLYVTIVYGTLQNQMRLDWIIDQFAKKPRHVDHTTREILRVSLYQLIFLERIPDFAVLDCANRLASVLKPKAKGFVNAMLRNVLRHPEKSDLSNLDDPDEVFRLTYSVPEDILKLYESVYGKTLGREILEKVNTVPTLSIRVNRLKTTREALADELENDGFRVKMGSASQSALFISANGAAEEGIEQLKGFKEGYFTVQDEGAMLITEYLGANPGDRVLDMCAAPGGKTTHLAELMENKGEIIACDIYDNRLKLIRHTAKRLGHHIIHTQKVDGTNPDFDKMGQFDRILIDAPCSGYGVIRRKPEIKYQSVNERALGLKDTQKTMLENGLSMLKNGGTLVYATCTVNPEENENVVLETIDQSRETLTVKEMAYTSPLIDDMDCFYMCRIQKG